MQAVDLLESVPIKRIGRFEQLGALLDIAFDMLLPVPDSFLPLMIRILVVLVIQNV